MLEEYRYPGEFEKRSDVFVTWFPEYIRSKGHDNRLPCVEIIKHLMSQVQVHINCTSDESYNECIKYLKDADIDLDKIIFTRFEDSNFYVRDNGPNVMVDKDLNPVLINPNWSYYGVWDPDSYECKIARQAGVHMGVSMDIYDIVNSNIISEGGNREFNGQGVLMAIEDTECRKRNPEYSKEEIEEEFKRIYNLEKIIWIPKPLYDDDDYRLGILDKKEDGTPIFGSSFAAHIDEMARFITENKILLAEVTEEEAKQSKANRESKKRLDEAYKILKNSTDANGQNFEIVRMPVPEPIEFVLNPQDEDYELFKSFIDDMGGKFADGTPWPEGPVHFYAAASYCNFLICNDVVLGQRYFHEGMDEKVKIKDEKAKEILQSCFPDRTVIMIDSLAMNLTGGGVHCWTKDVACFKNN